MASPYRLPLFSGGVNFVDPRIAENELEICQNMELSIIGVPTKRLGYARVGSSPAKINGDLAGQFVHRYYKEDGTKITLAAAGGTLRSLNDATGAWTTIASGMHATNLFDRFTYKDFLYILDGTQPKRWDGTNFRNAGYFVHTSSGWTATPTTGGSLTVSSVYQYKLASVEGTRGEGPASVAKSVTLSAVQNQVNLSGLDSAPAADGATFKNLYRTKPGGSIFYFVAQLAAGATTYNDTTADSALGAELVNVHVPQADARYAFVGPDERTYWFGRSGVNASIVEVSDVGFPDRIIDGSSTILSGDFFAVDNNNSGAVTGGCMIPGGMLFFKNTSTWLLRAFGYGIINISKVVGCTARFSIARTPNGAIWLSADGQICSYINGQLDTEIIGRKIKSEFQDMSSASAARIVAIYHKRKYKIAYDPQAFNGYNTREMFYDTIGQKWDGPHIRANAPAYYCTYDEVKDSAQLAWVESKAANGSYVLLQSKTTYLDNGAFFVATWRTGTLPGRNRKVVFKIFKRGKFSGDTQLKVNVITEEGTFGTTLNLTPIGASPPFVWGQSLWGAAYWAGSGREELAEGFPVIPAGTRMRIESTDNGTSTKFEEYENELIMDALPLA